MAPNGDVDEAGYHDGLRRTPNSDYFDQEEYLEGYKVGFCHRKTKQPERAWVLLYHMDYPRYGGR